MGVAARLGGAFWEHLDEIQHAASVVGTALIRSLSLKNWRHGVGNVFARQIGAVGIAPLWFVFGVSVFVGISVVGQLAYWTSHTGQSQMIGPLIVDTVIRQFAPIMTNIVIIVRSSIAMATELGVSKASGDIDALEQKGIDPFLYVVMPRVLAMSVSTVCLTLVFILAALASGFVFGAWFGTGTRDLWTFNNSILHALQPRDMVSTFIKAALPALFTSSFCCIGGLGVTSFNEIPQATQHALSRSIVGLFVISAAISMLMYL